MPIFSLSCLPELDWDGGAHTYFPFLPMVPNCERMRIDKELDWIRSVSFCIHVDIVISTSYIFKKGIGG